MLNANHRYAILWDMDGVLVDTGEYHYQAWKKTFDELEVPFSRDQFRETFGMNNLSILEFMFGKKLPPDREQEISERKESLFREAVKGHAKLLPGVEAALKNFSELSFKQAIASSAPVQNIEVLMQELQVGNYFDTIVSGANLPGKPDPAIFLKAAHQLDIEPGNCTVMEDAIAGVKSAKNAGMRCIAVTTINTAEALSQADLVLESLEELKIDSFFKFIEQHTDHES